MLKRILAVLLITSMLILPVSSVGLVDGEAAASGRDYLPGDVPAQTSSAESMSPALHALVLAMLNHDVKEFDFENKSLAWEGLYNMLSLYGQLDSRSVTEQGELFLPEETVMDYAAVLAVSLEELGAPPASIRDRLNYDNVSQSYVLVCGEDELAQLRLDELQPSASGYSLTGTLVYQVDGRVLAAFRAELLSSDNMFGYVVTGMRLTG